MSVYFYRAQEYRSLVNTPNNNEFLAFSDWFRYAMNLSHYPMVDLIYDLLRFEYEILHRSEATFHLHKIIEYSITPTCKSLNSQLKYTD